MSVNWDNHRYTTMTEAEFLELCSQDGIKAMSDADLIRRNYDIRFSTNTEEDANRRSSDYHTQQEE